MVVSDEDPGKEPSMKCQSTSSWKGSMLGLQLHTTSCGHLSHITSGRVKTSLQISQQSNLFSRCPFFPLVESDNRTVVTIAAMSPFKLLYETNARGPRLIKEPEGVISAVSPSLLLNLSSFWFIHGKVTVSFSPFLLAKSVSSPSIYTLPTAIKQQPGNSFHFI